PSASFKTAIGALFKKSSSKNQTENPFSFLQSNHSSDIFLKESKNSLENGGSTIWKVYPYLVTLLLEVFKLFILFPTTLYSFTSTLAS
ncbi:hypothetical protein, partial [Clostridium perfringens]